MKINGNIMKEALLEAVKLVRRLLEDAFIKDDKPITREAIREMEDLGIEEFKRRYM